MPTSLDVLIQADLLIGLLILYSLSHFLPSLTAYYASKYKPPAQAIEKFCNELKFPVRLTYYVHVFDGVDRDYRRYLIWVSQGKGFPILNLVFAGAFLLFIIGWFVVAILDGVFKQDSSGLLNAVMMLFLTLLGIVYSYHASRRITRFTGDSTTSEQLTTND